MSMMNQQTGAVNPLLIATILLGLLATILGGASVWSFLQYQDQKNNVDAKIEVAVEQAKKEQSASDEAEFLEREKAPVREYVGPDDLGRVSFNYPKTWSVYVANDGTRGDLEVYLHPLVVPTVENSTPYALRINVSDDSYDDVIDDYQSDVERGDLRSSRVTANGNEGVRFDGTFSADIKGSLSVFKVRDKTLTVATDTESFVSDYNDIILKSLRFNE